MACVLVTGGAGFLGAAVVRRLAGRGDRVVVLDNFQAGTSADLEGLGGLASYIEWYRRGQLPREN
jgi:nucleoside-diphosphate-sugar epimerase